MSMSGSLFRQNNSNNHDFSNDLEDLRQQNRFLYEQNGNLKKSLEELININTQLTESIEQFNNSHVQNFPHINQQQIEQLALRVIELEQELEKEKSEREKERNNGQGQQGDNSNTVEETLKVIEELVNSFRLMQEEYQQELERMEGELLNQKNQWVHLSEALEEKLNHFEEEYSKLLGEVRQSEGIIKSLEMELNEKNKNIMVGRKEMKISTTIQDLRMTLERQIEEKNKIIKNYENIIEGIRQKVNEKVTG